MIDHKRVPLKVLIATPYGFGGRGGIDRLNDMIFDVLSRSYETNIAAKRLVTRGHGSLYLAPFVFAGALIRLLIAKLFGKVDLLHICLSVYGSAYRKYFLAVWARYLRIPYIVHLHGGGFDQFWLNVSPRVARLIDDIFLQSEKVVVLGNFWASVVSERLPKVTKNILIIPNATPKIVQDKIAAEDSCVRLSFVGEVGRRKGTPQFIEALGRLASRNDWSATIAGNGDVDHSKARIQDLGIANRVDVPGWLGSAATSDLFRRTDIFVLPTFAENLPVSILEAFAWGIPVISTPVGAIPEIVTNEKNGLLIPIGDVNALTNAIERLIADRSLRERLGKAGQDYHAKYHNLDVYVGRLVALWQAVAATERA